MSILMELQKLVAGAPSRPTSIRLSPKKYREFLCATRTGGGLFQQAYFMNIPVDMEPRGAFCRNCGAPIQPGKCSYCGTSTGFAELLDREPGAEDRSNQPE